MHKLGSWSGLVWCLVAIISLTTVAGAQSCVAPPSGMVAFWSGEGNAQDMVNGNNGTLFNGVTFVPGQVGQAFSFDGVDDRVNVPDAPSLKLTASMTIEGWINVTSVPTAGMILFRGDNRAGLDPYYLVMDYDGTLKFQVISLTAQASLKTPIAYGQWHHVAATLDDATGAMKLYLDGVVVVQTTTTVRPLGDLDPTQSPGVGIGNTGGYPNTSDNYPFHGSIDELAVYNRALTGPEIQAIYNAGTAGTCNSASNLKIAFVSDRSGGNLDIYTMNADGSGVARLTNIGYNRDPHLSQDGSQIVFNSNRDGNFEIYKMNADGSGQTRLTNNSATDSQPVLSPDNRRIVFDSDRDGNSEIYVMNADGSNQTRLTNNTATDELPAWSPDGSQIVFTSARNGNEQLYIMNADGSNQTRLSNSNATDKDPCFTPDGTRIVFGSDRDGNEEIYIMNADGSNPTRLTNNPATDRVPRVSVDGAKIAFESTRDGNQEIYAMNLDGSDQTNISNSSAVEGLPSWGPAHVVPLLFINNVTLTQGSGMTNAIFTVTLSAASPQAVTVGYATADGTATAGSDYTATSGALTFNPGATSKTITVPVLGASLSKANATFTVNLTNPTNASLATARGIGTILNPVTAGTASISPNPAYIGNTLTANQSGFADAHGGTLSYGYQWLLSTDNGTTFTLINGATNRTYGGFLAKGQQYEVQVTGAVGGQSATTTSTALIISDTAPMAGTASITPNPAHIGDTLTANYNSFSDADGDTFTYSYQWLLSTNNGTTFSDINGATNSTYGGVLAKGQQYEIRVTGMAGGRAVTATSTAVTIADSAPVAGTASITPNPAYTGNTLTANYSGFSDVDGDTLTYTYQWLLSTNNGITFSNIDGATNSTYGGVLIKGQQYKVKITASDGTLAATATSPVAAILDTAPVAGTTSIAPNPAHTGDTLTANQSGFTDADSDSFTYSYQWLLSTDSGATFSNIDGAINSTYAGALTEGDQYRVQVTGTAGGQSVIATSPAVTIVDSAPVAGTASITPQLARPGDTLTASYSDFTDADGDTFSYSYQWLLSTDSGTTFTPISSAINSTYGGVLAPGQQYEVQITGTAGGQSATATSAALTIAAAPALSLSVSANSITEGGTLKATVSRNTSTDQALTVTVSGTPAEALTLPPTVTIPAGQTAVNFTLAQPEDNIAYGPRAVTITVSRDGFASATANVNLTDNDTPTLTLTLSAANVIEGGSATGTVTRNTPPTSDLAVALNSDNAAIQVPAGVTILAGQLATNFTISTTDDAVAQGNRSASIAATAGALTDNKPFTVVDNDSPPTLTLSVSPTIFGENGSATGTVTRNTPVAGALAVAVGSSDPSVATVPASVTIPAGSASTTFTVTGVSDGLVTGPRSASISAVAGALTALPVTITATETDVPAVPTPTPPGASVPGLSINDAQVPLAATGSTPCVFTVTLSAASDQTVTVNYATADGTAKAGEDYTTTTGTLTFSPGVTSQTITVPVLSEPVSEAPATFTVTLSGATLATLTRAVGTGTIVNPTAPALALSITPSTFRQGAGESAAVGTVSRNTDDTSKPLIVTLSSSNPRRAVPAIKTVTIPAGASSAKFIIDAIADTLAGATPAVTITATAPGLASASAILNVTSANKAVLNLTVRPARVLETAGVTVTGGTVSRNTVDTSKPLVVTLSSSNAAKATTPTSVTIPAKATSVNFPIRVRQATTADGPQRVTITATATSLVSATASFTVLDSESKLTAGGRVTTSIAADAGTTGLNGTTNLTGAGGTTAKPVLAGVPNAVVTLFTGSTVRDVVTTDESGAYSFTNLTAGSYTIKVALPGYTFTPAARPLTLTTTNVTGLDFTGTIKTSLTGRVINRLADGSRAPLAGITVTARSGHGLFTARTDSKGHYTFTGLALDAYVLLPAVKGTFFAPDSQTVLLNAANPTVSALDFVQTGTDQIAPTAKITGPLTSHYTVANQPTKVTGNAQDTGGAGVTYVTVAILRYTSATANTPTAFLNFNTGTFGAASALTEKLAAGPATWTLRSLPALTAGFYGVRATATDAAGNVGVSPIVRYSVTAPVTTPVRVVAAPVSQVGLSTATAMVATSSVTLRFLGALDADTASDAANYTVMINGQPVTGGSAGYNATTHTVSLGLPEGTLRTGDSITISWSGLQDAKGAALSGQTELVAAR